LKLNSRIAFESVSAGGVLQEKDSEVMSEAREV
jgi:hypothetical protein